VLLAAAGVMHIVDLSNSFVDDHHPRDPSTGLLLKNAHYRVERSAGEWRDSCPMVEAKLVVRVDDVDGAPLADHFDAINAFIVAALESSPGSVLIHCFRGKSRSATACVQHLMQCGPKLRLREAMGAVKGARPVVNINFTFKKELMDLERRLWPDEPPSLVLKLTSRKPVLTSSTSVDRGRGTSGDGGGESSARQRFASTSPTRPPPLMRKQRPLISRQVAPRRAATLDSILPSSPQTA
jgi:hypothetical protein